MPVCGVPYLCEGPRLSLQELGEPSKAPSKQHWGKKCLKLLPDCSRCRPSCACNCALGSSLLPGVPDVVRSLVSCGCVADVSLSSVLARDPKRRWQTGQWGRDPSPPLSRALRAGPAHQAPLPLFLRPSCPSEVLLLGQRQQHGFGRVLEQRGPVLLLPLLHPVPVDAEGVGVNEAAQGP